MYVCMCPLSIVDPVFTHKSKYVYQEGAKGHEGARRRRKTAISIKKSLINEGFILIVFYFLAINDFVIFGKLSSHFKNVYVIRNRKRLFNYFLTHEL